MLLDDGLRLGAERGKVVAVQRGRKGEHLERHHAGAQLLLDHQRHAANQLEGLPTGGRDGLAVLQILAAETESQERYDASHHQQQ